MKKSKTTVKKNKNVEIRELKVGDILPVGCEVIDADDFSKVIVKAGEKLPSLDFKNCLLTTNDYVYCLEGSHFHVMLKYNLTIGTMGREKTYLQPLPGVKQFPNYEQKEVYESFYDKIVGIPVTDTTYCFYASTKMKVAPKLPIYTKNMSCTFMYCTSLTTTVIPNKVKSMPNTFNGCSALTTAPTIPYGVTDMAGTFEDCCSLVNVPVFPNSVINMYRTFAGCSSLKKEPKIPKSVECDEEIFVCCDSLPDYQ